MVPSKYRHPSSGCPALRLICLLLILITHEAPARDADVSSLTDASANERKMRHPYCGLYNLYVAMKLAGREVDFSDLLRPEYIGSRKGSSLSELRRAAEDQGMYTVMLANATVRDLRDLRLPVIVHVKPTEDSESYDHFEMFLGTENGMAKILNPPDQLALVPFCQLVPRWNGNGLVISGQPIDESTITAPARGRLLASTIPAVLCILLVHWVKRCWVEPWWTASRFYQAAFSLAQGIVFTVAALLTGVIYHHVDDAGFLAYPQAAEAIQQLHRGDFIPKIGVHRVRGLLGGDTVFVDARLSRDFERGHLEGAISIPVDLSDEKREAAIAGISRGSLIVVYCQSAKCRFAEKVATGLIDDGFSKVIIFKGGWSEWSAANREAEQLRPPA